MDLKQDQPLNPLLYGLSDRSFYLCFFTCQTREVLNEEEVLQEHEVELVVCDFFPQSLYVMIAAILIIAKL